MSEREWLFSARPSIADEDRSFAELNDPDIATAADLFRSTNTSLPVLASNADLATVYDQEEQWQTRSLGESETSSLPTPTDGSARTSPCLTSTTTDASVENGEACTCQYGPGRTPIWYVSVKTCPLHSGFYDPLQAPEWAATSCGPGGEEVIRDKRLAERGDS